MKTGTHEIGVDAFGKAPSADANRASSKVAAASAMERWSGATVALHWLGATLLVGIGAAGFVMSDLPAGSSERLLLSRMHTVFGVTLMLVTIARLLVRRRSRAVAPLPLSDLHRRGVTVIHGLLYGVTFAIGMSGALTGATSAWPDYVLGRLSNAPALHEIAAREAHEVLVFALLGLVSAHVGGVMVHQLRKGGSLRRMVPFLR